MDRAHAARRIVMTAPARFRDFTGNAGLVRIVERALEQDRLPHALVFAGPPGVGKHSLAKLVARRLDCAAPQGAEPCGQCRSCRKIDAGTNPDVREIVPDGAFIKIEQVRALIAEIAFEPFESRYRVAILDPAEAMRNEAANSLLKTLEEPPSRTYLFLVTASPYALLPTIRSRCRVLHFGPVAEEAIARHVREQGGKSPEEARLAAASSGGSIAAALAFDPARHVEAHRDAVRFLELLEAEDRFGDVSRLAAGLGKDKEVFVAWMASVTNVLQDVYYAQVAPRRLSDGGSAEVRHLASTLPRARVVAALEAMHDLQTALEQNANRQIALEELYLDLSRPHPS
jgi:DNA polymerase-3 subunit delta'